MEQVTQRPVDRSRRVRPYGAVLSLSPELYARLDRAAQMVDLNRSAYVRNALSVQVGRHLGVDPVVLMSTCPRSTGWGRWAHTGGRKADWPNDDGRHLVLFCPHPECDGNHLINGGYTV